MSTITLWLLISFGPYSSMNTVAEFASREECNAVIVAAKEHTGRTFAATCIIANVVRR